VSTNNDVSRDDEGRKMNVSPLDQKVKGQGHGGNQGSGDGVRVYR